MIMINHNYDDCVNDGQDGLGDDDYDDHANHDDDDDALKNRFAS